MPKPIPKCVSMNMYTDEKTYSWRSYYIIYDKHKYIYIIYIHYIYPYDISTNFNGYMTSTDAICFQKAHGQSYQNVVAQPEGKGIK